MRVGLATAPSRPLRKGEPQSHLICSVLAGASPPHHSLPQSHVQPEYLNALLWATLFSGVGGREGGEGQRNGPPGASCGLHMYPGKVSSYLPLFETQAHILETSGESWRRLQSREHSYSIIQTHCGSPSCSFPFNQSLKLNPLWVEGGPLNFTCFEV